MKRFIKVVLGLLVVLAPAYFWLVMHNGSPEGVYPLELGELRKLANEMPGEKPVSLQLEHVAGIEFPEIAVLAGASWSLTKMPMYAYRVTYADGSTGLVDTGMDEKTAQSEHASFFDGAALARVMSAAETARFIVVTHEHYDHMGGIATHPKLAELAFRVTPEQLEVPGNLAPVVFPEAAKAKLPLLKYEQGAAIAPGVAVWRARGHTAGSQLVFVQRADGEEFLFLGDVAWHQDNYVQVRERARLATLMMGEDRGAVLAQLTAIKALAEANPKLHVIPGHDGPVLDALLAAGLLTKGF